MIRNSSSRARILTLVATLSTLAAPVAAHAVSNEPEVPVSLAAALRPLGFLLGEWVAAPGKSGETGGFAFKADVQGQVVVRTNFALYPASGTKAASRHDDLMVIFVDNGAVRADYFDSEGHVIRYAVTSPAAREVIFVSELREREPRFRLHYAVATDGSLSGNFDIAPPGKPDGFSPYLAWTATRAR